MDLLLFPPKKTTVHCNTKKRYKNCTKPHQTQYQTPTKKKERKGKVTSKMMLSRYFMFFIFNWKSKEARRIPWRGNQNKQKNYSAELRAACWKASCPGQLVSQPANKQMRQWKSRKLCTLLVVVGSGLWPYEMCPDNHVNNQLNTMQQPGKPQKRNPATAKDKYVLIQTFSLAWQPER